MAKKDRSSAVCTETMGNVFAKHVDTLEARCATASRLIWDCRSSRPGRPRGSVLPRRARMDTVLGELKAVVSLLVEGAVVALDDANQIICTPILPISIHSDAACLPPVPVLTTPVCRSIRSGALFSQSVRWFICPICTSRTSERSVFRLFRRRVRYQGRARYRAFGKLEHRFDSWRVSKRLDQWVNREALVTGGGFIGASVAGCCARLVGAGGRQPVLDTPGICPIAWISNGWILPTRTQRPVAKRRRRCGVPPGFPRRPGVVA